MVHGTEGQTVGPAAAEVGDVDILITLCPTLTPAEQRVSLRASMATQQHVETILGFGGRKLSEGRVVFVQRLLTSSCVGA